MVKSLNPNYCKTNCTKKVTSIFEIFIFYFSSQISNVTNFYFISKMFTFLRYFFVSEHICNITLIIFSEYILKFYNNLSIAFSF